MSRDILVLRALGLGDLLTAIPALRALRRANPGDRVVLAAPSQLSELVELIDAVDELLPTPGLGELRWPGPAPRLAVNLHGRGPLSITDLLATRPQRLLTHHHPDLPGLAGPRWPDDVHEVDRWCRLVEYAGMPADRSDLSPAVPTRPSPVPGAVVIHPGAAFPARRWPPDRFAVVARALDAAGHRVVVTGGPAERELAAEVAHGAGLPGSAVLAGDLGLAGLAAAVNEARLVICGDTGVAHLATAYRTPSVVLFGPTPPRTWGPPTGDGRHRVIWAGRTGDPHGGEPDPGLLMCTTDQVLAEVDDLTRTVHEQLT